MAFFGAITCGVLYLLGKKLFGKTVGLVAALLLAVYPLHVYMSSTYELAQPLFILLLCLTVHQLVSLSQMPSSWYKLISSGFLLGLASLTVPTILSAAPLLAIWLFFVGAQSWRRQVVRVLVFTISCSIVVLSWSAYVYAGSGNFQVGSGRGAMALFNGNCPLAWPIGKADIADIYEKEDVPAEYKDAYEEHQAVMEQAHSFPAGEARNAIYLDAVKRFFVERPKEAGLLLLRKAILYWCPYPMTVTRHSHNNSLTKAVQIISFVPILILALAGMYLNRSRIAFLLPVYIVVLSQWMTYSFFFPTCRYRAHVDAFLILLAAPLVINIERRIRQVIFRGRQSDRSLDLNAFKTVNDFRKICL
jgi:4-amino-4-deoxy-L-arabinose transferase-like glycosyltransferase